jgi:hypothetical protein
LLADELLIFIEEDADDAFLVVIARDRVKRATELLFPIHAFGRETAVGCVQDQKVRRDSVYLEVLEVSLYPSPLRPLDRFAACDYGVASFVRCQG